MDGSAFEEYVGGAMVAAARAASPAVAPQPPATPPASSRAIPPAAMATGQSSSQGSDGSVHLPPGWEAHMAALAAAASSPALPTSRELDAAMEAGPTGARSMTAAPDSAASTLSATPAGECMGSADAVAASSPAPSATPEMAAAMEEGPTGAPDLSAAPESAASTLSATPVGDRMGSAAAVATAPAAQTGLRRENDAAVLAARDLLQVASPGAVAKATSRTSSAASVPQGRVSVPVEETLGAYSTAMAEMMAAHGWRGPVAAAAGRHSPEQAAPDTAPPASVSLAVDGKGEPRPASPVSVLPGTPSSYSPASSQSGLRPDINSLSGTEPVPGTSDAAAPAPSAPDAAPTEDARTFDGRRSDKRLKQPAQRYCSETIRIGNNPPGKLTRWASRLARRLRPVRLPSWKGCFSRRPETKE